MGPQFTYAALLKMMGINLELLSDIDMHQMIECGVQGGYCRAIQRFAKANNPYMSSFDHKRECNYLLYVDKNSLYACHAAFCPTDSWLQVVKRCRN